MSTEWGPLGHLESQEDQDKVGEVSVSVLSVPCSTSHGTSGSIIALCACELYKSTFKRTHSTKEARFLPNTLRPLFLALLEPHSGLADSTPLPLINKRGYVQFIAQPPHKAQGMSSNRPMKERRSRHDRLLPAIALVLL